MKKTVSALMVASLLVGVTTGASASQISLAGSAGNAEVVLTAEAALFSVTVPTQLAVSVDELGVVTVANDAKIVNNSYGPVKVNDIAITPDTGWMVVDFATDMSAEKIGGKKVAFKINNIETDSSGDFNFTAGSFPVLPGLTNGTASEFALTYDAKVPAQKEAIPTGTKIATVMFTIGWDE